MCMYVHIRNANFDKTLHFCILLFISEIIMARWIKNNWNWHALKMW